MKSIRKGILALALLLSAYALANACGIWMYAGADETRPADVAIILGAAASDGGVSPVFRERINQGVWLYREGYVSTLIITGGYGAGNRYSDAYIGARYAMEQGVPEADILIEEHSKITEENLQNAKEIMDANGLTSALIVSDPLHMKRAMRMARDFGIEACASPTKTSMYRSAWVKLKFLAREVFFYTGYQIVHLL